MRPIQPRSLTLLIGALLSTALLLIVFDDQATLEGDSNPETAQSAAGHPVAEPMPDQALPAPFASASGRSPLTRTLGQPAPEPIAPGLLVTERLNQIKTQTANARLNYTHPEELAVGEQTLVAVGLTPLIGTTLDAADQRLAQELGVPPETLRKVTIRSTLVMIAELTSDPRAFEIRPLHANPRQTLLPDQASEWNWLVTALRPGEYDLNLSIAAIVRIDQTEEAIETSYTDRLRVHIDPAITGVYVLHRYWLPLLLIGLAATLGAGAWAYGKVFFRRQKRRLVAALAEVSPEAGQGYVFLSYSRRDQHFAITLARDLMRKGMRVWIDQRAIKPGDNWVEGIASGIEETDALIVVLSRHAQASSHVEQEVKSALERGKPLFPLIYKSCSIPEVLSQINAIDLRKDYATGLEQLVSAVASVGISHMAK